MSQTPKHSLVSKVVLAVVLMVATGLLFNLYKLSTQQFSTDHLEAEVKDLHGEVQQLQQENSQQHTTFQKEASVRNELNMKKEGEIILQIPIPSSQPIALPNSDTSEKKIILQWVELLF
jgi:cell division protein FtsB